MRATTITANMDITYTVKGSGWFWVRFDAVGNLLQVAPKMRLKKASRLFIQEAKLTIDKYLQEKDLEEDAHFDFEQDRYEDND